MNMPIIWAVAFVASFALYWRVAGQLLPAVLTVQHQALSVSSNHGKRWQRLALAFATSPLSTWVGRVAYPQYWMAAKLYLLRTTERTRRKRAFGKSFAGMTPLPMDATMQQLVTGQLISIALDIQDEEVKLQKLAEIERLTGRSCAGFSGVARVLSGMRQTDFDYARTAADYFGYVTPASWQEAIGELDEFMTQANH